ncbi:MAG TPA: hypothetical protein VJ810_19600 [Blastocatellia bacterium]|nr:hypothetical protein [Blastocatellia bacterium]
MPELFDEKLWFTMSHSGPEKKYFLCVTNPHTFIGRMYALDADLDQGFCVSKHEIAGCSAEAEYFIKGFLSGNEPEPPRDDNDENYPDDSSEMRKWEQSRILFKKTGVWKDGRVCEKCGQEMLPACEPGVICHNCSEN